mmetsp:Transcript_21938/g.35266  ORF Transcript_21938/g.35266 Transcript_21938/m.35266 type:complete len:308 (+) Transcript_21938:177-1100(+)
MDGCARWGTKFYAIYVIPTVSVLSALSSLIFAGIFIRAFVTKQQQSPLPQIVWSVTLFLLIAVCHALTGMVYLVSCADFVTVPPRFALTGLYTINVVYVFQSLCLFCIFFMRMRSVFKASPLAVSKRSTRMFISLSFCYISSVLIQMVVFVEHNEKYFIWAAFSAISILCFSAASIWLNALFASKLLILHRQTRRDSRDEGLVYVAVKTSLLCLISACSFVLFHVFFAFSLHGSTSSPHLMLVTFMFMNLDLNTNFCSVLLTFKYFDSWYQRLCGCCHVQCNHLWNINRTREHICEDGSNGGTNSSI